MSGILIISRPPGVFPADLLDLDLDLDLLDPPIQRQLLDAATNLTQPPLSTGALETHGHKLVGIGVALLVPVFSAFLAILTRSTTTTTTTVIRYQLFMLPSPNYLLSSA